MIDGFLHCFWLLAESYETLIQLIINLCVSNGIETIDWVLWITSAREIKKCQRICKKNVCAVCINIYMRANFLKYGD